MPHVKTCPHCKELIMGKTTYHWCKEKALAGILSYFDLSPSIEMTEEEKEKP